MTTKLTVSIDSKTITRAKKYAQKKGISLSKLIENYLKKTTQSRPSEKRKRSIKELSGIINAPQNFDHKTSIHDYLIEKHVKR